MVVAEGTPAPSGERVMSGVDTAGFERLGGISNLIAAVLERLTGFESRAMVLGHLQRGGTPAAFDRVLATRLGIRAAETALAGDHGVMVATRGTDIVLVPLASAVSEPRSVPQSRLDETAWFGV